MCRFFAKVKTMNYAQKKRFRALLKKYASVLGIGIAYVLFTKLTNWGIPCVSRLLTDQLCPGCGISRMFLSLLQLDFVAAARYNLLVFCLLPFFLGLLVYKSVSYIKNGSIKMGTAEKIFYIFVFILAIVFTILRNTDCIPFLQIPE